MGTLTLVAVVVRGYLTALRHHQGTQPKECALSNGHDTRQFVRTCTGNTYSAPSSKYAASLKIAITAGRAECVCAGQSLV